MFVGVKVSAMKGGDPPVLTRKLAYRYPPRTTCSPVVDVWCGERDTLGVLDIEIGLNTGRRLGIQATVNKDDAEAGADGISAERLVESL